MGISLGLLFRLELLGTIFTAPALGDGLVRVDSGSLRVSVKGTATSTASTATALTTASFAAFAASSTASRVSLFLTVATSLSGSISSRGTTTSGTASLVVVASGANDVSGRGGSRGGCGLGGGPRSRGVSAVVT